MGVIADNRFAGGRIFGGIVVKLGQAHGDGLAVIGEATGAFVVDDTAELALGVKALRGAGERDPAAQLVYGKVIGNGNHWLVELKFTTVANAFFKKEPDV